LVPSFIVHAVEKDSEKYEIDSDKAKEALQKLDQQLQAFSEKQISSPKIRGTSLFL
jgi:transcriptional regulator NrdR family protein